jgi:hypothetical protein
VSKTSKPRIATVQDQQTLAEVDIRAANDADGHVAEAWGSQPLAGEADANRSRRVARPARRVAQGESVNLADFLPRTWVWVDVDGQADYAEIARISPGLQAQLREDLALEWGVGVGDTVESLVMRTVVPAAGICQIQWHAHAPNNDEDALAIHGVDANHNPIAHYYDDIARRCGDEPSTCVSHELLEASIDPECDRTFTLPDGSVVAAEIADQVEGTTYEKNGVRVSNFNTRRNYGDVTGPSKLFDFLGKQTAAF